MHVQHITPALASYGEGAGSVSVLDEFERQQKEGETRMRVYEQAQVAALAKKVKLARERVEVRFLQRRLRLRRQQVEILKKSQLPIKLATCIDDSADFCDLLADRKSVWAETGES